MKTSIVRKPQINVIDPNENVPEENFQILSPVGMIKETTILTNGGLHNAQTVNTYMYVIPAHFATIRLDRHDNICVGYAFYTPSFKNVLLEKGDKQFITIANDPKESNAQYYHHNFGFYHIDLQEEGEKKIGRPNLIVPREIFKDINDFVYFLVSYKKDYEPIVKYSLLPKNQPFIWDKPVATSIYENQPLKDSKILLGSISILKDVPKKGGKYVLEELDDIYHWDWKDSEKNKIVWNGSKDERDEAESPICHIEYKNVVCCLASGEIVCTETIPIYVYKRNRNGTGNGITAFVWRSGNEDDLVKKSQVGYEEGDDKFYNNYPHLLESLSLGAIYHSYASLTHISSENVARYVLRYIAHQPEGYRSVSIEGHLLYLMGGPLYHIKEIFDEYRESHKKEDGNSKSQLPELTIEDFYRVQSLYDINKSLLHYDSNVAYVPVESYRKIYPNATKIYNEQIHYVRDILGIPEGSNGCKQLQILLDEIFAYIKDAGIIVDYVSSDIEFICNEARMLLVNRFTTKYLSAMTSYWDIKEPLSLHYKNLYKEIYHDLYFRNALQSLGYIFNGNGLDDLKSVPTGDDKANQMYGIANGKAYVERRNINVWDVVMKNYTNDLFARIFSPIRLSFPKVKCSADSRFDSKGYLNRAEMFETYLGGSVKLERGLYSSIPLYGEHMTNGYKKLNMDNWHILPKPSLFSFFMDHINRLRVTALSSEGKFNVYLPTWNMWAFELNKKLEFCKDNVFDPDKVSRDIIEKYYAELLYHTFLMNPDKAIAYFNLDKTVDDITHYINLSTESGGYFKYAYDSLEGVLSDINKELGEDPFIPQTHTLAVETEPYVLSCAEVNNKWIWRLTVKELSNRNNIEFKDGSITFESEGRKITFYKVVNNPIENISNNDIGFWIVTPVDVEPQIISKNDYYYKAPALSIDDNSFIEGKGVLTLVDSKKEGEICIPTDYVRLTFPYAQYTIFGELPIRHSISMKFRITKQLNAVCYLLQLSALKAEGKMLLFSLKPDNDKEITSSSAELLNVRSIRQPNFKIELNEIYELKISIDINPNVVKVEEGKSLLSGIVAYSLIKETKKSNGETESNHSWTSGNINWEFKTERIHYLVQELILWEYKARYGMLFNNENKSAKLLNDIVKEELDNIPEEEKNKKRKEIYKGLLEQTPIRVECFSIHAHGHHEKVELFREDNGLNITRVNKEVIAYAESELDEAFSDAMIAKFSWLNAEAKSIRYNLSFSEKVDKDNTDCPHGNCIKLSQASDKSIEIEVMPQSEGYILIRFPKGTRKISDIFYNLKEI